MFRESDKTFLVHPVPNLDFLVLSTGDEGLLFLFAVILHDDLQNGVGVHIRDLIDLYSVVKREDRDSFSEAASDEHQGGVIRVVDHELVGVLLVFGFILDIKVVLMNKLSCHYIPDHHQLIWASVVHAVQEVLAHRDLQVIDLSFALFLKLHALA